MSRARAEALESSSGSSPQRAMPLGDVFREERARAAPGRGRGESFMADAHCLGDGRRAAGRRNAGAERREWMPGPQHNTM
jgi:hypothetical protein